MSVRYKIHPDSILDQEDYLSVIDQFETQGKVIDDRGRNLIKSFRVKDQVINVKSFKVPHIFNRIAYKYFRSSKAKRSYEHACRLEKNNIGTPKPLAYFEYFSAIGIRQSYYFSKHLEYDLTFRELRSDPDYPDGENMLRQFTQFTFSLHEHGIFFKDHSAGNTLIVKKNGQYQFFLIDLNRMDFFDLDLDSRMKNFSKLTEDIEMVKIMSDEYAKLTGLDDELLFNKMWGEIKKFRNKYERRQKFKEWLRFGRK